jgi:hypothetical protein
VIVADFSDENPIAHLTYEQWQGDWGDAKPRLTEADERERQEFIQALHEDIDF